MKTGILARRPVCDTERHTVIRFGLKSALVAKYLAIVHGSVWKVKFCSYIAI